MMPRWSVKYYFSMSGNVWKLLPLKLFNSINNFPSNIVLDLVFCAVIEETHMSDPLRYLGINGLNVYR